MTSRRKPLHQQQIFPTESQDQGFKKKKKAKQQQQKTSQKQLALACTQSLSTPAHAWTLTLKEQPHKG